jgi:1,4-dihydroxy-2-naphthoate octaprenyltransferase
MWEKDLERGVIVATGLMIVNLFIGFIITIMTAILSTASTSASIAFLEIGCFLIFGGCMMSRQPLKDEDRFDETGQPTSAWRTARFGRQMLFAAVFLFAYTIIVVTISVFIPI